VPGGRFFYITNHGIPQERIDAVYTKAKEFFDLPLEDKLLLDINKLDYYRGYTQIGDGGEVDAPPDILESIEIGQDIPLDDPERMKSTYMYGPNVWPDIPGFPEVVYGYFQDMERLGRILYRVFALALGIDEFFFEPMTQKHIAQLRLLHYPAIEGPIDPNALASNRHIDFDSFTILATSMDGLQVENLNGEWIEAPAIPGTLVVNLGEMMERWTNDQYVATPHRVISPRNRSRYSIPFFFGLNFDAEVYVLPTCQSADNPPRYEPIKNGVSTERRVRSVYYKKRQFAGQS
jgi:isopenicillin N synthase-like dioxygenase